MKKQKTTRQLGKPWPKGTKRRDQIWGLISRPEGASIDELVEVTGLQKHTLRAMVSIEMRKREATVEFGDDKRYRVAKAGK